MAKKPRFLVTAGPTREMLDPVRFLSNVSTGFMGYALAREASRRGFRVALISGPVAIRPPKSVHFESVITAEEMKRAMFRRWRETDVLIMTAAVCDYTPVRFSPEKIKRIKQKSVHFKQTEDILKSAGERKGKRVLVGFALETNNLIRNAFRKLKSKNCDLMVLNRFGQAVNPFGNNQASMLFLRPDGSIKKLRAMKKEKAAKEIVREALRIWFGTR